MAAPGRRPEHSAAAAAHLGDASPGWIGWLSTVDHKEIGMRYIVTAFVFPDPGRHRGAGDAPAAGAAEPDSADARAIRPALHDARHDDDLPLCAAGAVGLQQLSLAAAAGRARHGVPAAQRASPTGSILFAGIFLYASFPLGQAPERRLVQLRAAMRSRAYNPGPNIDFYALGMVLLGISTTVGVDQFRRHAACACARRACRSTACRSWSGAR